MLEGLLVTDVYLFLAIFARMGAAVMVLPGFGELTIPARVRLALALTLTFVLFPLVVDLIPAMPANGFGLATFIAGEVLIGIVIGALARILVSSLQVAGTIIAFNSGLGSAQLFDPTVGQQGAITGAFLATVGVTLLFVTNLHHLMLLALVDSYQLFVPGGGFPVGDVSDLAAQFVSRSFQMGLQIAMPVVIVGILIYISMGLMARLMPQIQVFFIALPLQMLVAFTILALTVGASMLLFLDLFESTIRDFLIVR
ncbi:MAG: flagellar type III secretion system protein FliR [Alphaproteobacteria bacterium]|nr:flagellar type III secretion system protein FliR [Alphaproteobacteria bacterium]